MILLQLWEEDRLTAQNTTTAPDPGNGTGHAVLPVGSHGGLHDLERLPEGGDLEQVQTGSEQQVAELDGLLLERRSANNGCAGDLRHVGRYAERVDEWPDRGRRAASLREGKRIGYMSVVE
jgi:hypothetical protein